MSVLFNLSSHHLHERMLDLRTLCFYGTRVASIHAPMERTLLKVKVQTQTLLLIATHLLHKLRVCAYVM